MAVKKPIYLNTVAMNCQTVKKVSLIFKPMVILGTPFGEMYFPGQ